MESYYAGVDIGGTKTAVGLFDSRREPVQVAVMPTNAAEGCHRLTQRIGDQFRRLLDTCGVPPNQVVAAGAASPGPLDLKKGRIVYIPTMGFRDEPLRDPLVQELGVPVYLQNDANAAALCESRIGAGQGMDTVVYITVSTGIGCGVVIGGHIQNGAWDAAGELGHLCTQRGGRLCACGKQGCLEAYASGTAIAAIASERTGERLDAREVCRRAALGSGTEREVLREAADHLGYAVAAVYQLLDPDVVVLGGSVTRDYQVFREPLEQAAARYMQAAPGREPRLCVSRFDGEQVLRGAVWYACQQHEAAENR